jgi:hypothetical protein
MYSTFSHTFSSDTQGNKKFFLTFLKAAKEPTFEGKINDDKTVKKFQMKKNESGNWKIQQEGLPIWVTGLEQSFADQIEERATR